MADSTTDPNSAILDLSPDEKRAFGFLFSQADSDQLGVVTGERAVSFFERTHVSPNVLGEIWQIADTENRGLLTRPGFCIVLRLIGHYQAGKEPSTELAFKQGPLPKFDGLVIPGVSSGPVAAPLAQSPTGAAFPPNALQPQLSGQGPIRVPPLDPQKVQQYSGLFERSGAQNGLLDGGTAKAIFEKAGLPNEVLGKIWMLSDREQRGALGQTEFIVAMHLLTSMKTRAMSALPNTLPPAFYEAAARRGAPPPPGSRPPPGAATIPRQFTGGSIGAPPRAQSPLARPPGYGTPPPQIAQTAQTASQGPHWLITAQEKAKYDQFYATVDTASRGVVTGEQAVRFFSDSGLPEDTLASIWDLADINSEGQLNRDEFAVAMYLIRQQRAPNAAPLPAFLPPALVPPSMRKQNLQQQTQQTTAPAFDNASNTSGLPKSAADDLFGLDEPSPPQQQQPVLQPQITGMSATRDPFGGSVPASPSSPQQRFQPQTQHGSSVFKPFMPTSAFGASLASQTTGDSTTSSQGQTRGFAPPSGPPQQARTLQPTAMDDLLGDNDTHAAESSKLTNETTELANMSNQIGNLRSQMEQTQQKKSSTQADINTTSTQKKDLETRLQQFRAQYEQEARTVKELEQQLAVSRESTKKLGQELALLEGGYQDLQTQHKTTSQALQADQTENTNLKQRISQINAEVTRLKPEIEKMKLDARQQKGMVSINKKQLATNESSLSGLQSEKAGLEREAAERAEAAARSPPPEPSPAPREAVVSPAGSMLNSTNPFFRKVSAEAGQAERSVSPAKAVSASQMPSAFDQLFGPSFAQSVGSRSGTPPVTSFGRAAPAVQPRNRTESGDLANSVDTMSSDGRPTPSATPPFSERAKESPTGGSQEQVPEVIPPPPPESRQFTPAQLPVGGLRPTAESDSSSTRVLPPASHAGGTETPRDMDFPVETPGLRGPPGAFGGASEGLPGAFPATPGLESQGVPDLFPEQHQQAETSAMKVEAPSEAAEMPAAEPSVAAGGAKDDFDNAFAGFGARESSRQAPDQAEDDDPFATKEPQRTGTSQARGFGSEFPPIQSLEHDDESDSDDNSEAGNGFGDNFTAASPARHAYTAAPKEALQGPSPPVVASGDDLASARPGLVSKESTASALPDMNTQQSPPAYDQSEATVGHGERTSSNHFPPEFGGLLPAREDPTSPTIASSPPPAHATPALQPPSASTTSPSAPSSPAVERVQEVMAPEREESGRSLQTPQTSLFPSNAQPASPFGTGSTTETFHDAFSRPVSSFTDIGAAGVPQTFSNSVRPGSGPSAQTPSAAAPKNEFDEFDEFDDLAEAKEADKSGSDLDFGFGNHSRDNSEFNAAFDSPAASMITTTADSQTTPRQPAESIGGTPNSAISSSAFGSGFGSHAPPAFGGATNGDSSLQQTPQNTNHDWDAIFSGLDSSAQAGIDTSFDNAASGSGHDPWASAALGDVEGPRVASSQSGSTVKPSASLGGAAPSVVGHELGRAVTPGTEHDDPILKRLTGMGYPRTEALNALEMFDYDINKAVDHLTK